MQFGYLKMIYFKASRKVFEMKNSKIPTVCSASLVPSQKKKKLAYGFSHRSLGFKPGKYKWHSWWTNWITGSSSPSSFGLLSAYLQTFSAIKITWRLLQINEIDVQRTGGMILKRKHALPICSPHPRGLLWDQTQPPKTNHRFFPKPTIIPLPRTRLSPCDGPDRAAYYLVFGLLFPGFISDRHLAGPNKTWHKRNSVHCCHRWNCTFPFFMFMVPCIVDLY